MFGFKAFAEAPIAAEKEQAQAQPYVESGYWEYGYAEGDQQVAATNVGAIGSSAIGVYAIGRALSLDSDGNATGQGELLDAEIVVTPPSMSIQGDGSGSIPSVTVTASAASPSASSSVSVDGHKAARTYTVTVQSTGSGNKYYIDGVQQASLSLHEEGIYRFDVSDSSVSGHPFRFSTTSNGTHNSGSEYTTNVTVVGTAGSAGAYVEIEVTSSTPDLYYYCSNHSGMGGSITFVSDFGQVPFIIDVTSVAGSVNGGSIGASEVGAVTLTAAEASATGAAEATFADSIEVGLTAPQSSAGVAATASAASVTTNITSPEPSSTGTASASADTGTVNVVTPTSRVSGVEVPDAMPSIGVTAPQATISAGHTVTVSDNLSITVTSPEPDPRITTVSNHAGKVDRFTTKHNFGTKTVTLTFPTTFNVPSGVSSSLSGSWTVNSYTTVNRRLVTWDDQKDFAIVFFDGKRFNHSSNDMWMAVWEFDIDGNLTLRQIGSFLQWNTLGLGRIHRLRSSGWLHGDLETHPNASGDVQLITPLMYQATTGTFAGTYLYVNIRQISLNTSTTSHVNRNSLTDTPWALGKVANDTNANFVTLENGGYAYALPWRGDWGSRSRQNYLLWSYSTGTTQSGVTYNLVLGAENGDVVSVQSTSSLSTHRSEAAKFSDGTYTNHCIGDTVDDAIWWHDDSAEYEGYAERYLSVSESVDTFDTDMEVDITDSASQIAELLTSITAPDGAGVQNATGSAALVTVDVTSPTPSGAAIAEAALVSVVVTAAEPTSTGVGSASAGVGTATITQPESSATGGATGSADTGTATVSSPEPTSTGQGSVSTSIGTVTVTSPESSIDGSVSDDIGTVNVTAPEPTLAGDASADLVTVSITQPDIDGFAGTGSADVGTVTVTTPTPVIDGVEVPDALSTISVSAPEPTAKVSITHTVTDALGVTVTEPSASASSPTIASAALVTTNVSAPEPTVSADANKDVGTDPVSVTAPEPSVAGDASADTGTATVTSPEPSHTVIAEPDAASITVTAAEPSIEAECNVDVALSGGVDVTAPIPESQAVAEPALVSVSITSPEPTVTAKDGGDVDDLVDAAISVTSPEASASQTAVTATAGTFSAVNVTSPVPQSNTGSIGVGQPPQVDVSAPEAGGGITTLTDLAYDPEATDPVTSLFVELSIDGTGLVNGTATNAQFVDIGVSILGSASGTANVTVSDALNVTVSALTPDVIANANKSVIDDLLVNVNEPTGQSQAQDVTTTFSAPYSRVYENQTTISWGSTANQNTSTVEEGVIVLLPYGVTNPTGGTPFKPLLFATNNPSSTNAFVLQAREFTSETATSLITEYSVSHQNVQPSGYSSTSNVANFNISAIYLDNSTRYTDSDGVEWPTVIFGYEAKSRYDYTDSNETTTKWHHKWVEIAYNPVSESFVSVSKKYDVGQSVVDSGTYNGGIIGGHARNLSGNKLTFEFLYLNSFVGSNNVRQYRAEHHQLRVDTGVETSNLTSQTSTSTKSTWTSARTSMISTIEGRDTDATHIEGIAEDSVTYTVQDVSKDVSTSIGTVIITNAAPSISAGSFTGGSIPQVSVTSVDADGTEDRLLEIDIDPIGVQSPDGSGAGGFLSEPDGPPTITVTSPEGGVSQLTTVQEIGDIVAIDATAPEPQVNHDFEIIVSDLTAIDMDAPQPDHEVGTTNTALNVTVSTPEVTATNSSIAEPSLVTVDVISLDGGLLANSTALVDLLNDQIVSVSTPAPTPISDSESRADVQDVAVSIDGEGRADSEARPTGVNVFVNEPRPTVTSTGNSTATADIPRTDVTSPQHTLTIESDVEVDVQTVSVTSPESVIEITALASIPEVSVATPEESLTVSSEARPDGVNVPVQPPQAYLQAGASAEGSLVSATITSPEAGHTVATDADVADVAVTAPEPNAFSFATANEVLLSAQPVNVAAPEPSVLVGDLATASIPEVSVVSPESNILSIGEGSIPEISVVAPEPTTATDDIARGRADAGTVAVGNPEAVAQGSGSVASLPTVAVTAPEAKPVVEEFPTNIPVIPVIAPIASVSISASERTVSVQAENRIIVIEFEDRTVLVER